MKLKNKKTGEIVDFKIHKYAELSDDGNPVYEPFKGNIEEWEDYHEEPKEDYIRVIESFIHYVEEADESFYCDESVKKFVEKLKAWKRLKDKGFRFTGYDTNYGHHRASFIFEKEAWTTETEPDLDLLFGGEE